MRVSGLGLRAVGLYGFEFSGFRDFGVGTEGFRL